MFDLCLRRTAAVVVAVVACMAAAGCGGSSNSSQATLASAGSGASSGSDAAGLAAARADVATERNAPTSIGVDQPLTKTPGKTAAMVVCGAPICAAAVPLLKQPLTILGVRVEVFNAGTTPGSISSTLDNVVQAKPDVVIDAAVPPLLWKRQLSELAQARIPVVLAATDPPPGMESKVAATMFGATDRSRFGQHLANLVAVDSNGAGHSLYVWTPELTGLAPQTQGYVDTLKKNCPGCSVQVMTTRSSDVGNGLPTQVVSALQRDTSIKYVVMMSGDMVTGVPEAIQAAGLSGIKIISTAGNPVNYQYIRRGQQYADLTAFTPVYLWQVADAVARALNGQKEINPPTPTQWIFKSNSNFTGFPPFGSDFQTEFKKLWGVG